MATYSEPLVPTETGPVDGNYSPKTLDHDRLEPQPQIQPGTADGATANGGAGDGTQVRGEGVEPSTLAAVDAEEYDRLRYNEGRSLSKGEDKYVSRGLPDSRGRMKERYDESRIRRVRSVSRSRSRSHGRRSRSPSYGNNKPNRSNRGDQYYDNRRDYGRNYRGNREYERERFGMERERDDDYGNAGRRGSNDDYYSGRRGRYDRNQRGDRGWDRRGGRGDRYESGPRRDFRKEKCFNCSQYGHWARDCPDSEGRDRCFHCRKPGHMARNCPEKREGRAGHRRYDDRRYDDRRYNRSRSR